MYYRTEKASKTRVNVFNATTGEYLCQLTTKEAPAWLFRAERAAAQDAADAIERKANRFTRAREYLARRFVREASYCVQLKLAF